MQKAVLIFQTKSQLSLTLEKVMMQPHEQSSIDRRIGSVHSVRNALIPRPLIRALGYGGHMLLCVSGSLLPLTYAQASVSCAPSVSSMHVCSILAASDNTYTDQTFTSTVNVTSAGPTGAPGSPGVSGSPLTLQFNQANGSGNIVTTTSGSGIVASSIGGPGGAPGSSDGWPGNGGGVGGVIDISNSGQFVVTTSDNQGHGIRAISQGGVGSTASDKSSGNGMPGGTGGSGKAVTVTLNDGASVSTTGQESNAILAQSLGNVAGSGNETSLDFGGHGAYATGALGGFGGPITATVNEGASLSTSGANSNGVVAINRGSTGGTGASVFGGLGGGTGGDGGSGGDSGVTSITSDGSITTTGNASMGIVVQSSGGNGGDGGFATGALEDTAGQPGVAGKAGAITVTNNGSITTSGAYSSGILAQSFAGSGGVGGSASGSLFYDQGGSAPASTNGGTVNINLGGDITTRGDNSQAVIAQSIGGKGGMGGDAGGMIHTEAGDGGVGGGGGSATVTAPLNSGLHINTQGQSSHGIVAQSVGGGGGMGGAANAAGVNTANAIGGQGGTGGNGGTAEVNVMNNISDATPAILTSGPGAFGILSQSVGGGGGAGGGAYSVSAGMLADVSSAVGGAGGDGGHGGNADATLNWFTLQTGSPSAQNSTLAADSIGVAVQSIGGGGGQGGSGAALAYAIALPLPDEEPAANVTFAGAFAVGGAGGKGGDGGSATASVRYGSTVSTYGDGSLGVKVQSIGGGGGHGGDSSALAASIGYGIKNKYIKDINPQTNAVNISVAVGGAGGDGGQGGNATLVGLGDNDGSNVSTVSTHGEEATAVLVQSIGGGGGNAGTGNAKVQSYATSQNLDLTMSVGATGGSGGAGGTAKALIDNTGKIVTYGDGSKGLVVQSIGGGGGTGTGSSIDLSGLSDWVNAVAGGAEPDDPDNPDEGGGNNDDGGGGDAISASLSHTRTITVGAQGGTGGNGGQATVEHNAFSSIQTYGVDAPGIVAQSIGGGGGLGGSAAAKAEASASTSSAFARLGDDDLSVSVKVNSTLNVGGTNGASGSGGSVDVQSYGTIGTVGDHSPGIIAQSVGAGGGRGAIATSGVQANGQLSNSLKSIAASLALDNSVNLGYTVDEQIEVNPESTSLGDGGVVTASLNGSHITTGQASQADGQANNGFQSVGILAQSIGGGGGMAIDGTPGVQATAKLGAAVTGQVFSPAGFGSVNFGNGGAVNLNALNAPTAGDITTYGDAAHGVFLQSVGGGGGVFSAGSSQMAAGGGDGRKVTVGLGFIPGIRSPTQVNTYGGDGGAVSADFGAKEVTLKTYGHGAFGLLAQSIGGGGGTVAVAPGVVTDISYFGAMTGQNAGMSGASGNGGTVTVNMTNTSSSITTSGVGAHGIMAQSVGGGGGLIGNYRAGDMPVISGNLSTIIPASGSGNGGNINITASGTITTTGAGAMGILAQSVGGGGGLVANEGSVFAGSTSFQSNGQSTGGGGNINIDLPQANITALGQNSVGVWAQSIGASERGSMTVNVGSDTTSSTITGGDGKGATDEDGGAGIVFVYGGNNQVNISAGSSVQAVSGVAIKAVNGAATVNNQGTLNGNLLVNVTEESSAASAATSAARAGSITSAPSISLSNYGTFSEANQVQGNIVNQGDVYIGKRASNDTLHVTGDFIQGSQGALYVGTDFVARAADLLSVDGHAKLDGKVNVVASTLMPNRELTYLQAGTLTPSAAVQGESALFAYRTRQIGNALAVTVDAAKFNEISNSYGVGSNLRAMGEHLQDIWDRGSSQELGAMYAALNRSAGQGSASYANALNDLSPGVLAAPAALKQANMVAFSNSLMSCPNYVGTGTQMAERDCVWGRITGNSTRMDGSGGTPGLKSEGVTYQMGTQRNIAPNWYVGVAGAYENNTIRSDGRRQSIKGDTGYLGVSLKYEDGPWAFSGALTGSYGSFDNTRSSPLMGAQADSNSHVTSIAQRLRASYTHAMDNSYIKPLVDLDVIHTRMSSFDESGAGALNLHVEGVSKWTAIISPAVEFGGRFDLKNGYTVRPYASVGMSLSSTGKWDTRARFASAPDGTDLFKSTLNTGRVFGQISGGVQLLSKNGMDVRLQYDGLLSSKVRSHSASLKASWQF